MKRSAYVLAAALLAAPALAQEPKRSPAWESFCAGCHGMDGKATTEEGKKKKARDLTDARWQGSVSDDRLASSIRRGRENMPSFGKKLNDEQVKALVVEIRSLAAKK